MNPDPRKVLAAAVQHNCDISDARHGADDSLCVYLMKMREYYRWELGLPFGAPLPKDAVGDWLSAREQRWEALEGVPFQPITVDGIDFDPFDADGINARLAPRGLVYGGGLGRRAKPLFFLADLECRQAAGMCTVFVAATEHARDLAAPPAMSVGQQIYLRRESLRRTLWEKLESWRWNRPDNALGRAFACYDFDADLDDALTIMTDREIANALLHERGEVAAGEALGDAAWGAMLLELAQTPAELMIRAVRDHLADCLVTLPCLIDGLIEGQRRGHGDDNGENGPVAALHFYLGNLTHLRQAIFPSLAHAYETWRQRGDPTALAARVAVGGSHWQRLGERMLDLHRAHGAAAAGPIRALVDANHL